MPSNIYPPVVGVDDRLEDRGQAAAAHLDRVSLLQLLQELRRLRGW